MRSTVGIPVCLRPGGCQFGVDRFSGPDPWGQLVCRMAVERGGHHPGNYFDREERREEWPWRPAVQSNFLTHHLFRGLGDHAARLRQEPVWHLKATGATRRVLRSRELII